MPVITVKLAKGRTVEQKQQFVEAITLETVKTLNVKKEWVTVIFDEYEGGNWASSGSCIP
ncbi:tautomerase family protein [Peribacillus glennii]|uniref:4-oxalocrotonate tautomerase n=1 Tax=Peribacillus glennii TaxID=2303991 RepID=A0A372LB14_9BACI|nr:tautomerase family protein [Peribacillus glennii]RFU62971.1 4-oxalocrotonate tautomerase [Peribacillus glennii]